MEIDKELRKQKQSMVRNMIFNMISTNDMIGRGKVLLNTDVEQLAEEIPIVLEAFDRQFNVNYQDNSDTNH